MGAPASHNAILAAHSRPCFLIYHDDGDVCAQSTAQRNYKKPIAKLAGLFSTANKDRRKVYPAIETGYEATVYTR
ncbi:hypothetical protein SAMD00023353_0900510 [Rosellinia necatrix]|uniref:Uncharacterized protein n=1 Tax=Rosellinia necatrix TaxID=77044 RepID=A0A1S8A636_ROSNE|nr:hypothetical protein SAMD00023353_0900510 [Rosellinia necatrix]